MRSQDTEQQILNAIETQLRSEDPALAAFFMAFTTVMRNAGMPPAEQLTGARCVASRRKRRRAVRRLYALLIKLVTHLFAGLTMLFAEVTATAEKP